MNRSTGAATILFVTFLAGAALAQDAVPDLKGTWKGTGKILLFGTTEHLIGSPQNAVVRDLPVTHRSPAKTVVFFGARPRPRTMTARSRLRGPSLPTTRLSWAPTRTVIIGSPSCRPIGSRNATRRAEQALGTRLSPRVS
jgi:hypothetical protein